MLIIVYSLVDPSRGAHFDGLVVCAFLLLQGSIAVHSPYFSGSKVTKSWDNNIGSTDDRQLSDHPLRKMADVCGSPRLCWRYEELDQSTRKRDDYVVAILAKAPRQRKRINMFNIIIAAPLLSSY
ncbi:uncharacterized protein EAF02_009263 [Botrytis sinoallii]|uniref:uncharacterized protein n=1 Tax=Botrytis sinoallii TaxID=1463999 RepID=UPI0019014873|nr:uncharacterized protein EAF02_009263 [Botrytis sinoallii]KAF7870073.1 hypothetical protein EAF02_009263 [Botrytis sinoallii]